MYRDPDVIEPYDDVREVRQRFPASIPVFELYGIRPACHDCPIAIAAQRASISTEELVEALNHAANLGS